MPGPRRVPLVACLALGACGPERDAAPERPPEDPLAALAAAGYAGWDEGAESGLAGVTRFAEGRVAPGLNLYTNDRDRAYVVDTRGRLLHTWRVAGRSACETFELLEGGSIAALSVDEGVTVVDRGSNVTWHADFAAHHDVARDASGELWVPAWREESWRGRRVRFDELVRLSPQGERRSAWSTFDRRADLAPLHAPHPLDRPPRAGAERAARVYDYHHLNSVRPLPENALQDDARFRPGNLLLCLRNVHLVLILERETLAPVWHFGPGVLDFPHMPSMTADGTVLVFDNGRSRGWSRVLELDPRSGEVVWSWAAEPREAFFSDLRGSCQRLPNGNTLICESQRGHAFEVDPAGEIVWEFWNPEIQGGKRRRIYRFIRVPEERLAAVLERR